MDEPSVMRQFEGFEQLNHEIENRAKRQLASTYPVERIAVNEFGREINLPRFGRTKIVDIDDVWMVEQRNGARFAIKAHAHLGNSTRLFVDEFECDIAPQFVVVGDVDLAHSAMAQHFEQCIARFKRLYDLYLRSHRVLGVDA